MPVNMRRILAAILALMLLTGAALAENADQISALVTKQGLKTITAKNPTKLSACTLTEDDTGDTLVWSDPGSTYTVTTKSGKGLRELYKAMLPLRTWDTCAYTFDGKVQYAYNAPEADAVKSYKTLTNYIKYVTAYIDAAEATPTAKAKSSRQSYVLNTKTKKFHRPDCPSVGQMKDANRQTFTGDRDDILAQGYVPCKNCNP